MNREEIKKIVNNLKICDKILRGEISDKVYEICQTCRIVEDEIDPQVVFAVCMTVLSQLLIENKIIIKKEIKDGNKEKNDLPDLPKTDNRR